MRNTLNVVVAITTAVVTIVVLFVCQRVSGVLVFCAGNVLNHLFYGKSQIMDTMIIRVTIVEKNCVMYALIIVGAVFIGIKILANHTNVHNKNEIVFTLRVKNE